MIGEIRKDIMVKCPEEFKDRLGIFIDSIEKRLNGIAAQMEITSIGKLSDIEEAYLEIKELAEGLY